MTISNKLRIVRLATFAWVLILIFGPQFAAGFYWWKFLHSIGHTGLWDSFPDSILIGVLGGTLLGFIPTVFLGVFPAIVLESLVQHRGLNDGIILKKDSWHGSLFLMLDPGPTLCSQCWLTPLRILFTFWVGITLGVGGGIAVLIRSICFMFYAARMYTLGRKIKSRADFWGAMVFVNPFSDAFLPSPEKLKKRKAAAAVQREDGLVVSFISKTWDVLGTLKRRACPTIRWESADE